jgi:hypothetical protein
MKSNMEKPKKKGGDLGLEQEWCLGKRGGMNVFV